MFVYECFTMFSIVQTSSFDQEYRKQQMMQNSANEEEKTRVPKIWNDWNEID